MANKILPEIEALRKLIYNGYHNTSFSPDKRVEADVKHYSELLTDDLAKVASLNGDTERYKSGFLKKLTAWYSARTRIASSMITGPANFPVDRNRKTCEIEHRRSLEFSDWRTKALTAIARNYKKATEPQKELNPKGLPNVIKQYDGFQIIYNYEINRVQIIHEEKPSQEVIARLKEKAFKWSPTNKAWQRQLTLNGKWAADSAMQIKQETQPVVG